MFKSLFFFLNSFHFSQISFPSFLLLFTMTSTASKKTTYISTLDPCRHFSPITSQPNSPNNYSISDINSDTSPVNFVTNPDNCDENFEHLDDHHDESDDHHDEPDDHDENFDGDYSENLDESHLEPDDQFISTSKEESKTLNIKHVPNPNPYTLKIIMHNSKNQNQLRTNHVLFHQGDYYVDIFKKYNIVSDFENFKLERECERGYCHQPWDYPAMVGIVHVFKADVFSFYCCTHPQELANIRLLNCFYPHTKVTISTLPTSIHIYREWIPVPSVGKEVCVECLNIDGQKYWVPYEKASTICNAIYQHFFV